MADPREVLAERFGLTIRSVVAALDAPRPGNALARHQLAAIREEVAHLERDLDEREKAGLDAPDIAGAAARASRALRQIPTAPTDQAARLAMALNFCARLATGPSKAPPKYAGYEEYEPARLAVLAQGIGPAALSLFALDYPELAVKIDRASLDRLVMAWTAAVEGSRWAALASVWKAVFGVRVEPISIKNQTTTSAGATSCLNTRWCRSFASISVAFDRRCARFTVRSTNGARKPCVSAVWR